MAMKEVGFWCDVRVLERKDTASMSERSLLVKLYSRMSSVVEHTPEDEDDVGANRPDPRRLVDHRWFVTNPQLVKMLEWYLHDGACVESHELAYSQCRFPQCVLEARDPKVLGACTMTDGVYVWPEGYWHYVRYHHVRPPQEFLDHVTSNYRRALLATKALSREYGDDTLWLWEPQQRRPMPMPRGMQEWILANTTLQLASTREKRAPIERHQTWDHVASRLPSCCGCSIS